MVISFQTNKLEKQCNSIEAATRKWGDEKAKLLLRRLNEIDKSPNLFEFKKLPAPRCHLLKGDKKGLYSADLKHPFRLLFKIDQYPIPKKQDGSVDEVAITQISIQSIEDPH